MKKSTWKKVFNKQIKGELNNRNTRIRTYLGDKNNSVTEEDIHVLYDYFFNEVLLNYFHATLMRCVSVMIMDEGEMIEGKKVRALCVVLRRSPPFTTKRE